MVISGAGDRRDQDIRDQTRILGAAFDSVILYQDACQRGRAGRRSARPAAPEACKTPRAPATAKKSRANSTPSTARWPSWNPGDLCLILVDQVEAALAHIAKRVAEVS